MLDPRGGDITTGYGTDEIEVSAAAKNNLEIIKDNFTAIYAILQDAEEKQSGNGAMQLWLRDLKNVAYDIDDLLDELTYDASLQTVDKGHLWRRVRYYLSTSNPILSCFGLDRKIKSLREQLEHVVSRKQDFNLHEYPVEAPEVQGNPLDSCGCRITSLVGRKSRNGAKEDVLKRLASRDEASTLTVLPVVGMGGIGKTTLAKLVYGEIPGFDIKLWAGISAEFDIEHVLTKVMLNHSLSTSLISLGGLAVKLKTLKELLEGKRYFLVLDDVWVDDVAKWMDLKNVLDIGSPGSVVLITTRSPEVANITGTIDPFNLDRLPDPDCWTIFYKLAFKRGDGQTFPRLCEIGMSIVQYCRGHPLLVKVLGSMLRSERDEEKWLEFENMMDNLMKSHGEYDVIMHLLKLSYIKLPPHLKMYFAYLATFVKDDTYTVSYQVNLMRALGLAQIGYGESEIQNFEENYYMELFSKSMIQDAVMSFTGCIVAFKLHNMLYDVAVNELGEELNVITKSEFKVSRLTRHISSELLKGPNGLSDNKYHEKLFAARKTRTFTVGTTGDHVTRSFLEKIICSFKYLRILQLQNCFIDELPSSIGNLKHLRFLNLLGNPIKTLPDTICKLLKLQSLYLTNCEKLEELPKSVHRLISLRWFQVTTRQRTLVGTQFSELPFLQELFFISCERLTSLWESDSVGRLASLRCLTIKNCSSLTSLPISMKLLVALEELSIINCQELDLEDGEGTSLSGLFNLRYLYFGEMPQMTRVPDAIQSAACSLQNLWFENCGGLLQIPMWLPSFTSLQKLLIRGCPHLSERCDMTTLVGEDYHLIRHVPQILLDALICTKPQ